MWTYGSDKLSVIDTLLVINIGLLNGSIVYPSILRRFVSQLRNVTEDDSEEYTCSVPGNSTTATLTVVLEGHSAMSVFTFYNNYANS